MAWFFDEIWNEHIDEEQSFFAISGVDVVACVEVPRIRGIWSFTTRHVEEQTVCCRPFFDEGLSTLRADHLEQIIVGVDAERFDRCSHLQVLYEYCIGFCRKTFMRDG